MNKITLLNTADTLLNMGGEFAEVAKFVKEQLSVLESDLTKTENIQTNKK